MAHWEAQQRLHDIDDDIRHYEDTRADLRITLRPLESPILGRTHTATVGGINMTWPCDGEGYTFVRPGEKRHVSEVAFNWCTWKIRALQERRRPLLNLVEALADH